MCGIFCLFLNRPLNDNDINNGRKGLDLISHRGPDGSGEWLDRKKGVYIGHRRLSILDLSDSAAQPMTFNNLVMSYNGEIYNYKELREELKNYNSSSTGDSEVLLNGWHSWGEKILDKIDGMFAFSIWDGSRATLAVDPFGEKTLYWAKTHEGIYVSSELAALAKVVNASPSMEGDRLFSYLGLGYIPAPDTAYKNIFKIHAASVSYIENGKYIEEKKYWTIPKVIIGKGRPRKLNERELDQVNESIVDSMRGRILSDVPLCIFLSAGVDSSLVAAITKKELNVTPDAVTVSFIGNENEDEGPLASATAKYLGLQHRVIRCEVDSSDSSPQDVLKLYGQPCDSITSLAIRAMTNAIKDQYKVGLTGSGGDEVFSGYSKHAHFYRHRHLYAVPETIRLLMGKILRHMPSDKKVINRLLNFICVNDYERLIAQKTYPTIHFLNELPGFSDWCERKYSTTDTNLLRSVFENELGDALSNSRLLSMDIGSMRSSVELRTPFLNRKLIDILANFDYRTFVAFGQKSMLRDILRRYLPENLVNRPKHGFIYPKAWMFNEYQNREPNLFNLSSQYINTAWEKKGEDNAWRSLAVRFVLANEFERMNSNIYNSS